MTEKKSYPENKKIKKPEQPEQKNEHIKEAFEQAEKDIEKDPEFQSHKDEDLDEGELARKEGHP